MGFNIIRNNIHNIKNNTNENIAIVDDNITPIIINILLKRLLALKKSASNGPRDPPILFQKFFSINCHF